MVQVEGSLLFSTSRHNGAVDACKMQNQKIEQNSNVTSVIITVFTTSLRRSIVHKLSSSSFLTFISGSNVILLGKEEDRTRYVAGYSSKESLKNSPYRGTEVRRGTHVDC